MVAMGKKNPAAAGRCYDAAWELFERVVASEPTARLCHGIVRQSRPPHVQMGHAWVEVGRGILTFVFDPLFPTTPVIRVHYYGVGFVGYVKRYDLRAAVRAFRKYRSYGPWDRKVSAAAHAND